MTTNKNIIYYFIAIAIFILLKITYTISDNNDLTFLLKPTDKLIGLVTNSTSLYSAERGYFHGQLNILIDKSCSGFNFWILSFLMLYFLTLKFLHNKIQYRLLALPAILTCTYVLTIFVNTSRILFSVFIHKVGTNFTGVNSNWLHQAEGTFIYLGFLIIIYLGFDLLLNTLKPHYEKLA